MMFKVTTQKGILVDGGVQHKDGTVDGLTRDQADTVVHKCNAAAEKLGIHTRYEVRPL